MNAALGLFVFSFQYSKNKLNYLACAFCRMNTVKFLERKSHRNSYRFGLRTARKNMSLD